jgi:hypothetical protein
MIFVVSFKKEKAGICSFGGCFIRQRGIIHQMIQKSTEIYIIGTRPKIVFSYLNDGVIIYDLLGTDLSKLCMTN